MSEWRRRSYMHENRYRSRVEISQKSQKSHEEPKYKAARCKHKYEKLGRRKFVFVNNLDCNCIYHTMPALMSSVVSLLAAYGWVSLTGLIRLWLCLKCYVDIWAVIMFFFKTQPSNKKIKAPKGCCSISNTDLHRRAMASISLVIRGRMYCS